MADFIVCQVAQVFTKLGRKAQIYNRSLGKIALQSEKDNIVHLTNMIFVKRFGNRNNLRQRNQKAWLAKTSNASREELMFDQKASEVASSTVVMSMLDLFGLVWR